MEDDRIVGWLTLSDLSRRLLVDSEVVQKGLADLTDGLGGPPQSGRRAVALLREAGEARRNQLEER
jgi:hypothetical protein